jgi:hypothetical protein
MMDSLAELDGGNLMFIVGSPRSGTTWLQRLLATHPQIKTGQESRVFEYVGSQFRNWQFDINSAIRGRGGLGLTCYLTEAEFVSIQKRYLSWLLAPMVQALRPGEIFLEKTPSHALFVAEISKLLPQAKIIHLVRDPREVAASMLAASRGWGHRWAPRRAKRAVRLWWEHVNAAEQAGAALPPDRFLRVHYADLHRKPAEKLAEISRFLKISWPDPDIVQAVKANSVEELRQGKGTPIPVSGEHGKSGQQMAVEPKGFVRRAQTGFWQRDLTWFDRLQIWLELRKIGPQWKQFANRQKALSDT